MAAETSLTSAVAGRYARALFELAYEGKALDAVNEGNEGRPIGKLWYYWIKYVVPAGIVIILALGLDDLFGAFFG